MKRFAAGTVPCEEGRRVKAVGAASGSLSMRARAKADREEAGALLEWAPRAYWLALRVTGNAALAEDAVQDALVRLLRRPPGARDERARRVYFLRTVHNTALSLLSSERARERREEVLAVERDERRTGGPPGPEKRETARAARAALGALPPDLRVAVSLCCEQGLTQREAAEIAGVPMGTMARRVQRGLEKLKGALAAAGFASLAPALLTGAHAGPGVPAVPAGLATKLGGLLAGGKIGTVGATGAAGTAGTAAAKGGIAMKIVAGIVAASALAGAVAVSTGMGGGALPSIGDGKPAPVNPYKGMQEREEVYEFTAKPVVKKEGDKVVITFASKGKCDATVAILGEDGKIVRHLASGVLGANAPHPFQQNSLSQKIEWDGLADDFKKAPAGCRVRVSLGLKAEFERNLVWDPYEVEMNNDYVLENGRPGKRRPVLITGTDAKGNTYMITWDRMCRGQVFGKDGKYIRTFFPPPAEDMEKVMSACGFKFATTTWGGKSLPVCGWYGPFTGFMRDNRNATTFLAKYPHAVKALEMQPGVKDIKAVEAWPANIAPEKYPRISRRKYSRWYTFTGRLPRIAVDRQTEQVYIGMPSLYRLDSKTGEIDKTWFPDGSLSKMSEFAVGPNGMVYVVVGGIGHGWYIFRLDRNGKNVPFPKGNPKHSTKAVTAKHSKWWVALPGVFNEGSLPEVLPTGAMSHSNVHEKGFDVSPDGHMVGIFEGMTDEWYAKTKIKKEGKKDRFVCVWSPEGELLAGQVVTGERTMNGHGVRMDRDGNVYLARSFTLPRGTMMLDGITDVKVMPRRWGGHGTLVKFRGLGGKFPLGEIGEGDGPADAVKLGTGSGANGRMKPTFASGAQWAYGGLTGHLVPSCSCPHSRHDMDDYARSWVSTQHLGSIMVLDTNGNRIARLGKYGNVDDTTADVEEGRDGLRFAWVRATAVSDTALYAVDYANRRVMKAKIGYHAEETVGLDGDASVSTPAPTATAPKTPAAPTSTPAAPAATPPTAAPVPATRSPEEACRGWWSLAMSYKRAGRKDKAREYLQKIIAEHPKNEYAARARKEIARL